MKKLLILVALASSWLPSHTFAAEQCPIHRLTVSEIKTIKPGGGISTIGGILLEQLAGATGTADAAERLGYAAYAADHLVFDRNLLGPDADAGWDTFLSLIDNLTSGQDDLIVRVNGTRIVPGPGQVFHEGAWATSQLQVNPDYGASTGVYQPMFADSRLIPDTQISFFKFGTLRLIERDVGGLFGSDSDDIGSMLFAARDDGLTAEGTLTVTRSCFEPGVIEELIEAGLEDSIKCTGQAVYEVSFKVEPYQGELEDVPERLICGREMCADLNNLGGFDFRDGDNSELQACDDGYTAWDGSTGESTIIESESVFTTAIGNYRICELQPSKITFPGICGADIWPLGDVNDLAQGDIVVLKGLTATSDSDGDYLTSSAGQYLARCRDCVPGAPPGTDNAVVHVIDPNRAAAQWTVKKLGDKFALRADNGKYLARCDGCIPGVGGDSAFVHVSDPSNTPSAQFTISPAVEPGKFTLRSDNAKYLSPCLDCVPGQNRPGFRYNGSFHLTSSSDALAGWEISVRQKDRVDPEIYAVDRTFDTDIRVKPSEVWLIEPGEIVTINYPTTLTVEDGAMIENQGTIINHGTIKIGALGLITNRGIIVNNQALQLRGGRIDNRPGAVIDNSKPGSISNLGTIENLGRIFDPFGRYSGNNPLPNLPTNRPIDGFFVGPDASLMLGPDDCVPHSSGLFDICPDDSYKRGCLLLGEGRGEWDFASLTCTIDGAWLRANKSLHIAQGVTLKLKGTLSNEGTIVNDGTIDNSVGNIRNCGFIDPNGNGTTTNPVGSCTDSPERARCEDNLNYSGSFDFSRNSCTGVRGIIPPEETLLIPTGVTWSLSNLENSGSILIEENGAVIVSGGFRDDISGTSSYGLTNLADIVNYGNFTVEYDGNVGVPYRYRNDGNFSNYDSIVNYGDIVGISSIVNQCASTYDQTHNFLGFGYDPEGSIFFRDNVETIPCPPLDSDEDGVPDLDDAFPTDATQTTDADGDGFGDNHLADLFILNPREHADRDGDCGDPAGFVQTQTLGDGCADNSDRFPLNPSESSDTDNDCGRIPAASQRPDSGNACGDNSDAFPLNPREVADSDGDCGLIQVQTATSGQGCGDFGDAFPEDPAETSDSDFDGQGDNSDNCSLLANLDQRDTDADGFGNRCDADFNNDGMINAEDLGLFKLVFFSADPDADLNGDGVVNVVDLGVMKSLFFKPPGPSALAPGGKSQ